MLLLIVRDETRIYAIFKFFEIGLKKNKQKSNNFDIFEL